MDYPGIFDSPFLKIVALPARPYDGLYMEGPITGINISGHG